MFGGFDICDATQVCTIIYVLKGIALKTKHALSGIMSIIPVFLVCLNAQIPQSDRVQERPPVIDMHIHCYGQQAPYSEKDPYGSKGPENNEQHFKETYERFRKYNIVKAVVSGPLEAVETWKSRDEDNRIIRGIALNKPTDNGMNAERLKHLVREGKIEVFGEIAPYYAGSTLSDPGWQPYLKICEQFDIPVAVHTGGGPTEVTRKWAPEARLTLGDPYLIEDVLANYPRLRLYIMHSGAEWHEHTLRMMEMYPQLYSDLGVLLWISPSAKRQARDFLRNTKDAGHLDRVMFGSDQMFWPHGIEMSIEYLNSLDFLTEKDKRDILYNNAARFLGIEEYPEQVALKDNEIKSATTDVYHHAQDYSGFTLKERRELHRQIRDDFDAAFHDGAESSRYIWLNLPEFWPHSVIDRSGRTRVLSCVMRDDVADFITRTELGELPLHEYVSRAPVDGVIILHQGQIIFENYPRMFEHDKHIYFSVTKVFPSTCVALLEDRNLIDISKPIDTYLSELKGSDWEGIKIIDILDMASGMNCFRIPTPGSPDPDGSHERFMEAFGLPITEKADKDSLNVLKTIHSHRPPGQLFEYSNINTFALTVLVEHVSGLGFARFVEKEIWQPMGAESDAMMLAGAYGRAATPLGMNSTLRDLARFGLLFTPSGRKNVHRVISDSYLKKIQEGGRSGIYNREYSRELDGDKPRHNTYQWDKVMHDGDFFKGGYGGQGLYVSPTRDLVIAFFGTFGKDKVCHELPTVCRQLAKSGLFD